MPYLKTKAFSYSVALLALCLLFISLPFYDNPAFKVADDMYKLGAEIDVSAGENRRKGYVCSFPNNLHDPHRYETFVQNWKDAYPELEISRIETTDTIRGLGVAYCFYNAFKQAIMADLDIAIILEDDALPYKQDSGSWKQALDERLKAWPLESPALFIGGHHIVADASAHAKASGVGKAKKALGAFGYVIRRHFFPILADYMEHEMRFLLNRATSLNVDVNWWGTIFKAEHPAYITLPLLVDHAPGYSLTWGKRRADTWSGQPNWWDIDYSASKHP